MNEIKPVAYFSATKDGKIIWSEDCCCEDPVYPRHDDDSVSLAVYSESSKQSLQKENADLQAENDDQKRKIISLENELVEWNEFKKIRDAQMQALRKQMP